MRLARLLLGVLALAAGCTDAVTYTRLGHVFTANMTGNTVLLGIAAVSGHGGDLARSACALGGFCAGVAAVSLLLGDAQERLWPRRATAALGAELLALVALAGTGAALGAGGGRVYWLIAVSGLAMGAQSAAVRAIAVPGVATTYITGTLTGVVADAARRQGGRSGRGRPAQEGARLRLGSAIWGAYLAAAAAGAVCARGLGLAAFALPAAIVAAAALAALAGRARLSEDAPGSGPGGGPALAVRPTSGGRPGSGRARTSG